jgi:hypothetical protein
MYVDVLYGREAPEVGWYLQAVGRAGGRNSAYLVRSCYRVRRRDPGAAPRYQMEVEAVDEIPPGARVFEFRWYPRRKKRKQTFEEYIARRVEGP